MTALKIHDEKTKIDEAQPGIVGQSKLVKSKERVKNTANRVYSTGRRKSAVARVWIQQGTGKISINKKSIEQYFTREFHIKTLLQPFIITKTPGQYDITCTVKGGGMSGQMGAILHGIARALDKIFPESHAILRHAGLLTRDSRGVERKKYGRHKARKRTQFSKR